MVLLNLQAVYALALYSDDDSDTTVEIVQVLILLVLIYYFIVISYHCLMSSSSCSKIIVRVKNMMVIHLKGLKDKLFTNSSTFDAINLEGVNNHVSENYHEFQESLIAVDN